MGNGVSERKKGVTSRNEITEFKIQGPYHKNNDFITTILEWKDEKDQGSVFGRSQAKNGI